MSTRKLSQTSRGTSISRPSTSQTTLPSSRHARSVFKSSRKNAPHSITSIELNAKSLSTKDDLPSPVRPSLSPSRSDKFNSESLSSVPNSFRQKTTPNANVSTKANSLTSLSKFRIRTIIPQSLTSLPSEPANSNVAKQIGVCLNNPKSLNDVEIKPIGSLCNLTQEDELLLNQDEALNRFLEGRNTQNTFDDLEDKQSELSLDENSTEKNITFPKNSYEDKRCSIELDLEKTILKSGKAKKLATGKVETTIKKRTIKRHSHIEKHLHHANCTCIKKGNSAGIGQKNKEALNLSKLFFERQNG